LTAFEELVAPVFRRILEGIYTTGTLTALRDTMLPKLISGELRLERSGVQND
jgi:type I restriction enzyme S subunit